jgi:Pregnancy-associated plasma protein-A/Secretion system C-terminal sorting domain
MKKILYLLLLLFPSLLMAQNREVSRGADRLKLPKTPRRYYTQKNYQRLLTIDREMAIKRSYLERSIPELAYNGLPREVNIPVVVHILYKSGSDTRNLPKESDIKQQLDITSKDFRQTIKIEKHDADKKEKFSDQNALDTKVSFCLATQDPTGRNTSGVLTVPTSVTTWLADDKMKSATTGGSTAWNTEKYLNIWVVSFPDSISGYAQMPAGPIGTDGIVIDARYFGKKNNSDKTFPYTEGKTLTHLIGNYLNVYDLWSETVQCGDDGVDDTPIQNAPTIGCVDHRYVSTCGDNPVVMTMNFMDNTNDDCQYMFTNGQKRRMHACLVKDGIRYGLVQSGDAQCGNNNLQTLQARNADPLAPVLPSKSFSYRIYPNPAQESVNFDIATEQTAKAELMILNAQGGVQKQMYYNVNEGSQSFEVKCSDWSPGVYLVRLKVNDEVKTEKIIINR